MQEITASQYYSEIALLGTLPPHQSFSMYSDYYLYNGMQKSILFRMIVMLLVIIIIKSYCILELCHNDLVTLTPWLSARMH